MFGMSLAELFVVFVIALVVLGPDKLPEVARWLGKTLREVRRAGNMIRDTLLIDEDLDLLGERNTRKDQLDRMRREAARNAAPPLDWSEGSEPSLAPPNTVSYDSLSAGIRAIALPARQVTPAQRQIALPTLKTGVTTREVVLGEPITHG